MNDIVRNFEHNVYERILKQVKNNRPQVYNEFFYRVIDVVEGMFNVNPKITRFALEQEYKLIDSFIACWKEYSQSIISDSEYYEGEYKKAVADFVKILEEERKKLDENIGRTATED